MTIQQSSGSPTKRNKANSGSKGAPQQKLNGLGTTGMPMNHNLQKMVRSGPTGNFDPSQFRGVTDGAGGVFGMQKREVTEFDLRLVYKHQQAQQ